MRIKSYITYKKEYEENIQQDLVFLSNSLNVIDLWCVDEDELYVDISGATVIMMVKENPSDLDTAAVINKTVTSFTNPTAGNTIIEITKDECESLVGNYVYELRISMVDSGHEYILKNGNICFQKSIYGIV